MYDAEFIEYLENGGGKEIYWVITSPEGNKKS